MSGERVYLATGNELGQIALPPSVVSGSSVGGALTWKAKTAYAVNQLVTSGEVTYICIEAHTSGETFSGVGTHWAVLGGSAMETHPKLVEAGEVEGSYEPNCANGNVFQLIAQGAVKVKLPINTPRTVYFIELVLTENSAGGHPFTTEGYALIGEEPKLTTTANAVNVLQAFTINSGATWYLVGLQAGKEGRQGTTGATGPEGPEGFNQEHVLLPSEFPTWKKAGEAATENRQVLAESFPRLYAGSTLELTSGVPVIAAIPIKAGTVITGIGFLITKTEETSADRTHLWGALLSSTGAILKLTEDFTSSSFNACSSSTARALKFESTYEATANGVLYAVLCEVMSATKPITIASLVAKEIGLEIAPKVAATGPSGQTTPGALSSPVTLTAAEKLPWLCLV
jgi:hypothetical protein